jgi:hypothetical protein
MESLAKAFEEQNNSHPLTWNLFPSHSLGQASSNFLLDEYFSLPMQRERMKGSRKEEKKEGRKRREYFI